MLPLIVAYRHEFRIVQDDIGRHQDGVEEDGAVDGLIALAG